MLTCGTAAHGPAPSAELRLLYLLQQILWDGIDKYLARPQLIHELQVLLLALLLGIQSSEHGAAGANELLPHALELLIIGLQLGLERVDLGYHLSNSFRIFSLCFFAFSVLVCSSSARISTISWVKRWDCL